jgi:LuxR family transcriptional regulator, maltose regulon positive regulatory protein
VSPDGWALLADARWDEARVAFLAAGETAEAQEGLSWAAWWLDDADTVFAARELAFRLYEVRGDAAGAARMATWLAVDELDFRGAFPVANGWLRRAHRLLDGLDPTPEHGWLAFQEGYLAHAAGDTAAAAEQAARVAEAGRRFGVPDLQMLGLALEGASHVSCARVREGMRCLDEATATALAGGAAVPISGAWTCCFTVGACTAVLDLPRAVEWCDRIAAFAERYGSRYMLAFCRAEYAEIDVWRGEWARAEAMFAAAIDDFGRSRPAWVGGPLVGLAALRVRQGRLAEAEALLERAGPSSAEQLCRARLALEQGRPRDAADLVERLLRQLPAERRLRRAPALRLLAEARPADADAAVAELRALAELAPTALLRACADLAEGVAAAARSDHDRARRRLEDAVDGFERGGAPVEAASARQSLATTLAALGRHDAAEREAARARAQAGDQRHAADGSARAAVGELTPREREVLGLLAEGLTNREIAERLVLSEHTVHRHVAHVLAKLGVPSRAAAAARAARAGM